MFLQHLAHGGNLVGGAATLGDVRANRYRAEIAREGGSWTVRILDPAGAAVRSRACRDEAEARDFASTVRQHIGWLSERRFREYYRLPDAGER